MSSIFNWVYSLPGDGVGAAAKGDQLHQLHVGLPAYKPGGVVHTGLEGPLVKHLPGGVLLVESHRVLADHHKAEGGRQLVDAVVDLRVDVVGPPRQHKDGQALPPRLIDVPLAGAVQVLLIAVIGLVGRADGVERLTAGDTEGVGEPLGADALVIFGTMESRILAANNSG